MAGEVQTSVDQPTAQLLDPFSYFPGVASKIAGLGGSEQRPDLAYGFHTHYVPAAPGHCMFTVMFKELRASTGQIHLRVHLLSTKPGAQAHVATVERIDFVDLLGQGGVARLRFESLPDTIYAVYGMVLGTTDAIASGLDVELDRPADAPHSGPADATPEPSRFRSGQVVRADLIQSDKSPTIKTPTSQVFTRRQLGEPVFALWSAALGPGAGGAEETWAEAFVLQTLQQFGFLDDGAVGAGFDPAGDRLSTVLAQRGCRIVADDSRLLRSTGAPDGDHAGSAAAPLDFLWSRHRIEGMADMALARDFLLGTLDRLRPNGLAIHITDILLDAPAALSDAPFYLGRQQIERMTIDLLSRGHSVSQLRFALGAKHRLGRYNPSATVPFGWVVRRGR